MFRLAAGLLLAGTALAQIPADIGEGLQKIGPIADIACTARLYRPLMPPNDYGSKASPLYPGIQLARDVSFGPHAKDKLDVFAADAGEANRPVLIFVSGGAGNKTEQAVREANAFYDNIGRWAAKNGMVGVLMLRHAGAAWDDPAKDFSALVQWVRGNIGKYKGDPDRIFVWGHSGGTVPVATYIGRPELWGPGGVGLKGAVLMSSIAQWNILPLTPPRAPRRTRAGAACNGPDVDAVEGAIDGPGRADPPSPPPPPAGAPPDAAVQFSRSTLPELKKTAVKLLLASAELDPGASGGILPFNQALHDELCKDGADRCPGLLLVRGHSHMSEVFSIDTPDDSVSGPILRWIRNVH